MEWTYKKEGKADFQQVYYFHRIDCKTILKGHLKKRSAVIITSKQVKLVINQTKASDDGIYRMKIQGSETAICVVNCTTRSKSIK